MDKFPLWIDHILAFLYCIAIPFYGAFQRRQGFAGVSFTSEQKKGFYINGSFSLFLMAFVVMLVWLLFRRPINEIGLTQPTAISSWWWMAIAFLLIYFLDSFINLSSKKKIAESIDEWKKRTPFLPTKKNELPEYFLMCFSAGVFEEIVYRGYLVTYCWYVFNGNQELQISSISELSTSVVLAVGIPALAFSLAHIYQGWKALIKIYLLSLFFGYIFVLSGSLLIVMILHFLIDAIGGLLTMKYLKEENNDEQISEENNLI